MGKSGGYRAAGATVTSEANPEGWSLRNMNPYPLHAAAHLGDLALVKKLITKKKEDFNRQNQKGQTPCHSACLGGQLAVLKYLVEKVKAKYDVLDLEGISPALLASQEQAYPCLRYLLDLPIRMDVGDLQGNTCLHNVVNNRKMSSQDKEDAVRRILSKGMDINKQNTYVGDSALHMACRVGANNIVSLLIAKKADASLPNHAGDTPAHVAATLVEGLAAIQKISEVVPESHMFMMNSKRLTPHHVAKKSGNTTVLDFLMKKFPPPEGALTPRGGLVDPGSTPRSGSSTPQSGMTPRSMSCMMSPGRSGQGTPVSYGGNTPVSYGGNTTVGYTCVGGYNSQPSSATTTPRSSVRLGPINPVIGGGYEYPPGTEPPQSPEPLSPGTMDENYHKKSTTRTVRRGGESVTYVDGEIVAPSLQHQNSYGGHPQHQMGASVFNQQAHPNEMRRCSTGADFGKSGWGMGGNSSNNMHQQQGNGIRRQMSSTGASPRFDNGQNGGPSPRPGQGQASPRPGQYSQQQQQHQSQPQFSQSSSFSYGGSGPGYNSGMPSLAISAQPSFNGMTPQGQMGAGGGRDPPAHLSQAVADRFAQQGFTNSGVSGIEQPPMQRSMTYNPTQYNSVSGNRNTSTQQMQPGAALMRGQSSGDMQMFKGQKDAQGRQTLESSRLQQQKTSSNPALLTRSMGNLTMSNVK